MCPDTIFWKTHGAAAPVCSRGERRQGGAGGGRIAIAARNNLVLETGHSSGSEDLVIIEEAKGQGVQNVVVTRALTNPGGPLTLSEIQQTAKLGASIERVYGGLSVDLLRRDADVIRAVGAASVVLASDLGQPNNPLHTDGLLAFYKGLMALGISEADIV
jgi:Family of unknown function (DUF6282)